MRPTPILIAALLLGNGCTNDELTDLLNGKRRADGAVPRDDEDASGTDDPDADTDAETDAEPADAGETDGELPDAADLDAGAADAGDLDGSAEDAALDAEAQDAAIPPSVRLDFESGSLPMQVSAGAGLITPTQGFATYGPTDNTFGDNFLRSPSNNLVAVTFQNLPDHTALSLELLFAAIDSLDGTGTPPAGDYFQINVDGGEVFRHTFYNLTDDARQSYQPPPGVQLARRRDLGFGGGEYNLDSAYDLGADPTLQNIPHTASTVTITFFLTSAGVQDLSDESWAIDNLRLRFVNSNAP